MKEEETVGFEGTGFTHVHRYGECPRSQNTVLALPTPKGITGRVPSEDLSDISAT